MNVVAELIKDGQVVDTYTFVAPTRDDLDASNKAFAYFRDRNPNMTLQTDDVRIEFRDESSDAAQ
jgi:hypothetical protein